MNRREKEVEIRLTRDDLLQIINSAMKEITHYSFRDEHEIAEVTLHPGNKYVLRAKLSSTKNNESD